MRDYLAYLLILLVSCGQGRNNAVNNIPDTATSNYKAAPVQKKGRNRQAYLPIADKANPGAKSLMTDSFYFSPVDATAPFGNDEGLESYAAFKDWRPAHKNRNSSEFVSQAINYLGYPKFDINETDIAKLAPYLGQRELGSRYISGTDAAILAIAFGQLYLEGTIDKEMKEIGRTAIKRQLLPEFLALWGDPYKDERKMKLTKMLQVLNQ